MPSLIASAVVGGIGAAGSIASGVIGSNAAKDAAKLQANAATLAANNQMKMFDEVMGFLGPYRDAGGKGLDQAMNLMGLGSSNPDQIQSFLAKTPGYQFTRQQGLESVENSYAARGLGASGAAMKGAEQFATGLADQTYEERLGDYMKLAGMGQNAAAGTGAFGLQATTNAGNFLTSGAAASAAGAVGSANAWTNALGGVSQNAMMAAMMNSGMFGSPGGAQSSASSMIAGSALAPGDTPFVGD